MVGSLMVFGAHTNMFCPIDAPERIGAGFKYCHGYAFLHVHIYPCSAERVTRRNARDDREISGTTSAALITSTSGYESHVRDKLSEGWGGKHVWRPGKDNSPGRITQPGVPTKPSEVLRASCRRHIALDTLSHNAQRPLFSFA
jgi:hypothetical protein